MKCYLKLISAPLACALLTTISVQAETREKMPIALEADDIELTETGINTLTTGKALTIETQSGHQIDFSGLPMTWRFTRMVN